tara:strand:+ start:1057 stop:1674 length:618 start_codon:yes stop_codon:yes gene_type:complete
MSEQASSLLYVATTNQHKLKEFSQLLEPGGFELKGIGELQIGEIIEDGNSFTENALIKARTVFIHSEKPTLADDSGLEVKALDGAPGIYSARYAQAESAIDAANRQKLLTELANVPEGQRQARFRCALAYCADGVEKVFEGKLDGRIDLRERGDGGFGYDPIFIADGYDKTLAEISQDEKNSISHRRMALNKLLKYFEATTTSAP